MTFDSIDQAQKELSDLYFEGRNSAKKATGRAIGTLQEILVYSLLHSFGLDDTLILEYRLPELGFPEIRHNIEFSLHPRKSTYDAGKSGRVNIRASMPDELEQKFEDIPNFDDLTHTSVVLREPDDDSEIIHTNPSFVKKNSFNDWEGDLIPVGRLDDEDELKITNLSIDPVMFIECKRVGLEEGTTTGPQTIEKAKQAAYVALKSSKLQKIVHEGRFLGVLADNDSLEYDTYEQLWNRLLEEENPEKLKGVTRSVLFVSDHGNWFPGGEEGKDIKILKGGFDWVIWVKDDGLIQLIQDLLIDDESVKNAFTKSYDPDRSGQSLLTKGRIEKEARDSIFSYVDNHRDTIIEEWFEVLESENKTFNDLIEETNKLLDIFEDNT